MKNLNKVNKQIKQKQTHRGREQIYVCPVGRGWSKKGKGMERYRLVVTNSHEDVKCSTGNIVSNIVIAKYGARWGLELSMDYFLNYIVI